MSRIVNKQLGAQRSKSEMALASACAIDKLLKCERAFAPLSAKDLES